MTLGIMQPYLFPYIGYFQLINAVDKFVIYDDVSFIKQGWINRNNILLNGNTYLFTVPLKSISSNALICNTEIENKNRWEAKFVKTIIQAYKRAPYFTIIIDLIKEVIGTKTDKVGDLATAGIKLVSGYIGIDTDIQETSRIYQNSSFSSQERVLDICKLENAAKYINPIGGQHLYSKNDFHKNGIELYFLKPDLISYEQFGEQYLPSLSIIDVLMFNEPSKILNFVNQYKLI